MSQHLLGALMLGNYGKSLENFWSCYRIPSHPGSQKGSYPLASQYYSIGSR